MKVIGLMSGTSLDGIDAALLDVDGGEAAEPLARVGVKLLAFRTAPYPEARREAIRAVVEGRVRPGGEGGRRFLLELVSLHAELGEWMAEAVLELCAETEIDPSEVAVIGSHGQTIWHTPATSGASGATLQLGDAARIAERTGIPVVSDFRSRDIAAGGQGAPLVPWADQLLFSVPGRSRAIQNLGGMGNVTWLPPLDPEGAPEGEPFAFDTGPGVALIDAAAELATGGAHRFDAEGALASRGEVDRALLTRLMAHPFFTRVPPRSTGREAFGRPLVLELSRGLGLESGVTEAWADLVATLTALTARSIAEAYRRWVIPRGVDEVFLTGGGARNPTLRRFIEEELAPLPVRGGAGLSLDPDAREAAAFALLGWAHLRGIPGNVPGATGAVGPRVLGSYTPGGRR